jgi:hypothetical protein
MSGSPKAIGLFIAHPSHSAFAVSVGAFAGDDRQTLQELEHT